MIRISDDKIQKFEQEHIEELRLLGPECTLFLKKDNALPFSDTCKVALYGSGARNTIKGGTGSGDVNVRHSVTIEEGLEKAGFTIISKEWMNRYDELKEEKYQSFIVQVREEAKKLGLNPVMYGMGKPMPEPEYEFPLDLTGSAAVYVLARNSGEGADRSQVEGDIELSETEIRDINKLNQAYERFVLVLNVGGMVNLKPVADVKNILLLGQLGTNTGDILADLLLGKSYPSGKLAMTWAPISDYSSTEGFGDWDDTFYKEGIYVGYRYFDAAKIKPTYPFGYGLSYTNFKIEPKDLEADEKQVQVTVTVKNTGTFKGKEVIQVYASAPIGKLDKPVQELVGFAKTKELLPEEEQEIIVTFDTERMTSFDTEASAYLMEAGNYVIRVGNSSQDTKICGIVALDETVIIEKTKNICPGCDFDDWKPELKKEESSYSDIKVCEIHGKNMLTRENHYKQAQIEIPNMGKCNWQDVVSGEKTLDEFVGGLSEEQLTYLSVGLFVEGENESMVGSAAQSIAGGAGETTTWLKELGVPTLTMADGPAGLRLSTQYKIVNDKVKTVGIDTALAYGMDFMSPEEKLMFTSVLENPSQAEVNAPMNYVYCSAIPIGTALAQSWNEEVCKKCGDIVGTEMEMFGVNLWLAPAMNIQRSPLCGRNFEYLSEDPLISGIMAAAITEGVQIHKGCGTTVKHFACNNQETNRMVSNSVVSERALREIYLKGFEICVKKSQPQAIMSSYNLINGEHTCNSKDLLNYVLRDEWGYQGIVMTDWYATENVMVDEKGRNNKHTVGVASGCVKAGNDITMPGSSANINQILKALEDTTDEYSITKTELQITAKRVLEAILKLS